jgi:hypothetical protein
MESALTEIQRDDELRYVTQHFTDLQGLQMVPFWAALVVLSALEYAHAVSRRQGLELILGMLALAIAWLAYAGSWYRQHYGFLTRREERVPSQILSILQTHRRPAENRKWPFLIWVSVFALLLVPLFQHQSYGRFNGSGPLTLSIFLLRKADFTCPASPWIRGRHLLAIGGSAMIVILHVGYLLGRLDLWMYMGATGTVLLLASLYDHWLLNRLLSGRLGEGRDA